MKVKRLASLRKSKNINVYIHKVERRGINKKINEWKKRHITQKINELPISRKEKTECLNRIIEKIKKQQT